MATYEITIPDTGAGFQVVAITDCPHLEFVGTADVMARCGTVAEGVGAPSCEVCHDQSEVWVCLHCGLQGCSRFVEGHAASHNEQNGHPLAISLSDMSCWCYSCESYLDVFNLPALHDVFRFLYRLHFGEEPALPNAQGGHDRSNQAGTGAGS